MTSSLSAAHRAAWGKYDVVHIHAEGPAAMCFLPKLHGKKVVVTVHGLDWARAKWGGFATKYIKFGERQAVKQADEKELTDGRRKIGKTAGNADAGDHQALRSDPGQ